MCVCVCVCVSVYSYDGSIFFSVLFCFSIHSEEKKSKKKRNDDEKASIKEKKYSIEFIIY